MSSHADIVIEFNDLIAKHPDAKKDLLYAMANIFGHLGWHVAAEDVIIGMIDSGIDVDQSVRDMYGV
jgi:hypothetical protein